MYNGQHRRRWRGSVVPRTGRIPPHLHYFFTWKVLDGKANEWMCNAGVQAICLVHQAGPRMQCHNRFPVWRNRHSVSGDGRFYWGSVDISVHRTPRRRRSTQWSEWNIHGLLHRAEETPRTSPSDRGHGVTLRTTDTEDSVLLTLTCSAGRWSCHQHLLLRSIVAAKHRYRTGLSQTGASYQAVFAKNLGSTDVVDDDNISYGTQPPRGDAVGKERIFPFAILYSVDM